MVTSGDSGEAERDSGIGLKLFGFIPDSAFTFIPDHCSESSRMAFGIIPESRSLSPGILNQRAPRKGALDRPSQTDPIWTIRAEQKDQSPSPD